MRPLPALADTGTQKAMHPTSVVLHGNQPALREVELVDHGCELLRVGDTNTRPICIFTHTFTKRV